MIMEARRFDTFVKTLGTGTTRRRMLRGLLAGVVGSALVHRTRSQAMATNPCGCSERRRTARQICATQTGKCKLIGFACKEIEPNLCSVDPGQCKCVRIE
jgi:hypothetical protein